MAEVADTKTIAPPTADAAAPAAAKPAAAADSKSDSKTGAAAGKSKKASDGKIYESSVLPNQWTETKASPAPVDRTIWMLTVQDPKANTKKTAGQDESATGGSKLDPATGLVFPDMYYLLGERVTVGKKDAMQLAKCFKGTGHDSAEWPSGLITVKCGRCDQKCDDGVMTIQKHLRLIGKVNEKKITCRLMPRLICDACYKFAFAAATRLDSSRALPAFNELVSHKSYWIRWAELQPLVDVLSKDFVSTMSEKISNGRTAAPPTVNEHGIQTIRYLSKSEQPQKTAESAPAALDAPARSLFEAAPTPAAAAQVADLTKCGGCGKADPNAASTTAGGGARFAACGGCGKACYCSKDCQKAAWKVHKPFCKSNSK